MKILYEQYSVCGTQVVKSAQFAFWSLDSADFISSNQKYLICIHIHISGPYVSPV